MTVIYHFYYTHTKIHAACMHIYIQRFRGLGISDEAIGIIIDCFFFPSSCFFFLLLKCVTSSRTPIPSLYLYIDGTFSRVS